MDLQLKNRFFIVCGATSGLGNAVASSLLAEGARVLVVARDEDAISEFVKKFPENADGLSGNLFEPSTLNALVKKLDGKYIDGIVVNAGGPPAGLFSEMNMGKWDEAYNNLLRWKVQLLSKFLPVFVKQQYGRLLFIESVAVKQPVPNLVLSNSLRLAVVGLVKTLSQEYAGQGITFNILAPGYHDTKAIKRLIQKRSEQQKITEEAALEGFTTEIPVGRMGEPAEFAIPACWLLSPLSGYINGQTFSIDGGLVRYVFG